MALLIAEELLLVAYREDGTAHGKGSELDLALGGALLVELALAGNVELTDSDVVPSGQRPVPTEPELAAALTAIATKPRRPKAWVQRLAKGVRRRLLDDLVARGVLTEREYRRLGVFAARAYPAADPAPRQEITGRLRAAVIDGELPDERTAALASMIAAAGLERRVFPEDDRKLVKRRLKEIAEGDVVAAAVRRTIQAAHAATMAAVTAATTVTASS
jgi:hypothetical protein